MGLEARGFTDRSVAGACARNVRSMSPPQEGTGTAASAAGASAKADGGGARPLSRRAPLRTPLLGALSPVGLVVLVTVAVRADEVAIVEDIAAFLQTTDTGQRDALVERITADRDYAREKVGEWLHRAELFRALEPGRTSLQIRLRNHGSRTIVLRIPKGYDPGRPWPLLYALHGASGNGDGIIAYYARILGADAERFVIAAPDHYGDLIINQDEWPPNREHPAALLEIKRTVHVDGDRVYVTGYSLGGHTTWALAVLHADQFAGALPLAGTFTILLPNLMWETFLPNVARLPVLGVWGERDTQDDHGHELADGGIAGANRRLRDRLASLDLSATMIELPAHGHRDVVPPREEREKLLSQTRAHYPRVVRHVFRDTYQGQAYWLEAHQWTGEQWTNKKRTVQLRPGEEAEREEDLDKAAARLYRGLLGELEGQVDGQQIHVRRKNVKELTIWIGDGLIDWDQPVILKTGEKKPFEVRLTPDLYVCLSQAARTWDFDRLRWAGVRIRSGAKPTVVDAKTEFPGSP